MNISIETASSDLANAQAALIEAEAHQTAARDRCAAIQVKIDEATNQQGIITRRRIAGEGTDASAHEFAALGADLDLLRGMLAEGQAAAQAITTTAQKSAVAEAERKLHQVTHQGEFDALRARATEIDSLLCRAVAELHQIGHEHFGFLSLSKCWQPSMALRNAITAERVPTL